MKKSTINPYSYVAIAISCLFGIAFIFFPWKYVLAAILAWFAFNSFRAARRVAKENKEKETASQNKSGPNDIDWNSAKPSHDDSIN